MLKNKKIAIVGLGYVGLPLAVEFGKKYKTIGYDLNQKRIEEENKRIKEWEKKFDEEQRKKEDELIKRFYSQDIETQSDQNSADEVNNNDENKSS